MSIGYACLTVGVENTNFKSCILKNASEKNLEQLVKHNLKSLENIIDYNIKNNIKLFRISSDIIPFGSSNLKNFLWKEIFADELKTIGNKIKDSRMRVSMHPGQYTVLNSVYENVVKRAVEDLEYHKNFLEALEVDNSNKIILHIGGVYGDKKSAMERFCINYKNLDISIKNRLIIENDDKSYNISEVLQLGSKLAIPVVYDNLHNKINCFDKSKDDSYWINKCAKTWKNQDGIQKIHYSQQDKDKKSGSHSITISINEFMEFYKELDNKNIHIMLEVKDKNLSAIKCINCTTKNDINTLEYEWGKYKYLVLEHSPKNYNAIRTLLKDKTKYPAVEFYILIENAMKIEATKGNAINVAKHIWGYFTKLAEDKEKETFKNIIQLFEKDKKSVNNIKNFLFKMAVKYNEEYVIKSYYFI